MGGGDCEGATVTVAEALWVLSATLVAMAAWKVPGARRAS